MKKAWTTLTAQTLIKAEKARRSFRPNSSAIGSTISGRSVKLQNLAALDYDLSNKQSLLSEVLTHTKAPPTSARCIASNPKHLSYKSQMSLSQQPIQMGMSNDEDLEKPVSHL